MSPSPPPAFLYDLTPPITPELAVWPGDTPFSARWMARIGSESAVNLSTVTATVHLGAHADAPLHTEPTGCGIDGMPLDPYLGLCRVVDVTGCERIRELNLPDEKLADPPRLLLKSVRESRLGDDFPTDFPALCPRLAQRLATAGVRLVGTDCPSVDPFESRDLEAHHALLGHGVAILEGLRLAPVPVGLYELIALPLPLAGLDASPVRAVLRAATPAR